MKREAESEAIKEKEKAVVKDTAACSRKRDERGKGERV
jgi:hypothetical protein